MYGKFIKVSVRPRCINQTQEISFKCEKKTYGSEVKIFIFDILMFTILQKNQSFKIYIFVGLNVLHCCMFLCMKILNLFTTADSAAAQLLECAKHIFLIHLYIIDKP